MANPRQRKKARSSSTHRTTLTQKKRLHSKLKKAPPLRGPDALAEAWDNKKTVFQNYAELGLLASLPVPKGDSRKVKIPFLPPSSKSTDEVNANSSIRSSTKGKGKEVKESGDIKPKSKSTGIFGRIVRDEAGNVIDIIIDEDSENENDVDKGKGDEDVEMAEEEEEVKRVEPKTAVVQELERISALAAPVKRHSSTSEKTWLADLVKVYGDDTAAMVKDRSRNVWQKTEGEIKRMIRKAGGVEKLSQM